MGVSREWELRLDVAQDWALPDLAALAPQPATVLTEQLSMSASYFDTDDRRLLAAGASLLRRSGDDGLSWELRLPGDPPDRARLVAVNGRGVPSELRAVVRGVAAGSVLRPVAMVRTERTVHRIQLRSGAACELIDDRITASVSGEAAVVASWREVALAPGTAEDKLLGRLNKQLHRGGARPHRGTSRLARLLEITEQPHTGSSLADLLNAYLSEQVRIVVRGDLRLRSGDLSSVHATRVAIRRYRSVLRAFATILEPGAAPLDAELAWYADLLGDVRDLEVTRRGLERLLPHTPAELSSRTIADQLAATIAERTERARAALARGLTGRRYLALMAELRRYTDAGPCRATARPAAGVAAFLAAQRRVTRKRLRRARRRGDDIVAWHRARMAAKRMRYLAELARPVLGKPARRLARRAKAVQHQLGDLQDGAVLLDLLRNAGEDAARAGDVTAVTLGALYADRRLANQSALARAARRRL